MSLVCSTRAKRGEFFDLSYHPQKGQSVAVWFGKTTVTLSEIQADDIHISRQSCVDLKRVGRAEPETSEGLLAHMARIGGN